ncbi:MAG: SoxR reducing system RseC family protein [Odoribacter sp.]|nr:SoxR reducing system RseC family protein [Odoribacter sp.]
MLTYNAVVTKSDGRKVSVILKCGNDACHACAMAAMCPGTSDTLEIEAGVPEGKVVTVGSDVVIATDDSHRMKAVLLLLLWPVISLVLAASVTHLAGWGSKWIAVTSLAAFIIAAFVAWAIDRSRRELIWSVID